MISKKAYENNARDQRIQVAKREYTWKQRQESLKRFEEITHPERRKKKA